MSWDVAGQVILSDMFSGVLSLLVQKTQQGTQALETMGQTGDVAGKTATAHVADLTRQIEALKAKAAGGDATVLDVQSFQALSSELASTKAGLSGLTGGASGVAGMLQQLFPQVAQFAGPAGLALLTVEAGKAAFALNELAEQRQETLARFTAFAGGASAAAADLQAMDDALGNAMTRGEKVTAVTRIMGLELANSGQQAAEIAKDALVLGDASASAGEKIEAFTQMLVTGQTRGLAQFGISAQVVRQRAEELRAADAGLSEQQATTNAILEQAAEKARAVEAAGGHAATQTTELGNAWTDLKKTMSAKIQAVIQPIILPVQQGLAEALNGITQNLKKSPNEIELALDTQALTNAKTRLAKAQQGVNEAMDLGQRIGQQEVITQLAEAQAELTSAQIELKNAQDAYDQAVQKVQQTDKYLLEPELEETRQLDDRARALAQATAAQLAFGQALSETYQKLGSVEALAGQLGGLAGTLKGLAEGVPAMPELPKTLGADTAPLEAWLDLVKQLRPNDLDLQKMIQGVGTYLDAFKQERDAVLANELAMGDHNAALLDMAQHFIGVGAGVQDLVRNFQGLDPQVQQAATKLGLFGAVLAVAQAKAAHPVTVDMKIQGAEAALQQVDAMALQLSGILSPERIAAWREKARQAVTSMYLGMGPTTELGMKAQEAQLMEMLNKQVSDWREAYQVMENDAKSHFEKLGMAASAAKSMIDAALNRGLQVSSADMLAAQAGIYQNVAEENARRLDAIAARGHAEIKQHPDWIDALKIPPSIIGANDDVIKAWAARMANRVREGLEPGLIDKEGFLNSFKQNVADALSKEQTLNQAVQWLKESGIDLPNLTEEELKAKVAGMLGMEPPKISFEAQFITPEDQKLNWAKGVLGADPGNPYPMYYTWKPTPTASSAGLPTGGYNPLNPPPSAMYNTPPSTTGTAVGTSNGLVAGAGAQMAADLFSSYDKALKDFHPGTIAAGYLASDLAANAALIRAAGVNMSGILLEGLANGVSQGANGYLALIAQRVTPMVLAKLQAGQPTRAQDGGCR